MTIEKKFYGEDLEKLDLDKQDFEFLVNKGLSVGSFGHIDIVAEFELTQKAVIVGYDSSIQICCYGGKNKGIFAKEPEYNRYVNSSAAGFYKTLLRYAKYCKDVLNVSDENEALIMVNDSITDFRNIDKEAWSKEDYYWPIIAQQMLDGNL